ncbi:MAG: glycosyltransferase [Planctomycetales bacterium]|nr:glycosyltransferase [Planctomycetales bacterium]
MSAPPLGRIMMISTHGYVSAEPEFGKPDTGGQVVYVLELSKCLGRMGYEVDVLTRQFEDQVAVEKINDRVTVRRFPCGGDDFIPKETLCDSIPEWVENVSRWIRGEGRFFTLINSHYWDAGLAGQALASRFAVPHFHTPHSIGAWKRDNMDGTSADLEEKYNFKQRIREEKVIYDECDVLIATTPAQKLLLLESDYDASPEKICVIPPGYDDRRFFPVSRATRMSLKQEFDLHGKIVLALGRMAKNKGYDLLLRAMPPVFERIEDARLLLAVGSSDPNPDEIKQVNALKDLAAELGIADRVIFRDYISDEQLPDFYRAADLFALCSRYEPFGMTAVEAMACGTPTVVTTEGGLWEQTVWGLDAVFANPFDPPAFGHAIAAVLQHESVAAQLAKHGSQKARAKFTWTGIAHQLLCQLQARQSMHDDSAEDLIDEPPTPEVETWSAHSFS